MKLEYKLYETDLTDWAPTTKPETTRVFHRAEPTRVLETFAARYIRERDDATRYGQAWTEPQFANERLRLKWEVSRRAYEVLKQEVALSREAQELVAKQCALTAQKNELQQMIDRLNGKHEAAE